MPDRLRFTKMQGVGNDFVIVDGREYGELDWSVLAIEICDRKFGVGADGLLVLDSTYLADFMMRMYNPDGTPDVCGNGLRCLARFAVDQSLVSSDSLKLATLAGVRTAQIERNTTGAITAVTVSMGSPRFDPFSIPMHVPLDRVIDYPLQLDAGEELTVTALSTGTSHAVTLVDALPEDSRFFRISPQVEDHVLFPERTSLMWCVVDAPHRLRLRIWERGVGETWGCGTGACAAAVAAILHGLGSPDEPITVASRGGELIVRWNEGNVIQMTGPAETVFDGTYRLDPSRLVTSTIV